MMGFGLDVGVVGRWGFGGRGRMRGWVKVRFGVSVRATFQ